MKFEGQSSKPVGCVLGTHHSNGAFAERTQQPRTLPRRGSVLVLVMTLLGILFVVGVAFLGTMNFEASMIAAETTRSRGADGVKGVADGIGSKLRDGVMFNGAAPFAAGSGLAASAFAELPSFHNVSSPIEPYRDPNGTPTPSDDRVLFPWFTDLGSVFSPNFGGTLYPHEYQIDTAWPPGSGVGICDGGARHNSACLGVLDCPAGGTGPARGCMFRCEGGPNAGLACNTNTDCSDYLCAPIAVLADADGDGVSDAVQFEASVLKLSPAQMSDLSARLNPPSNPNGKVYVGMRIIPHTGMANLNYSHPYLLRTALNLPTWPAAGDPPDPGLGNFVHGPTQYQALYAPSQDEATMRHRGGLLPRRMAPSRLFGDPSDLAQLPSGGADMQWQLFAPVNASAGQYESVFERVGTQPGHRYWGYRPDEYWADNSDNPTVWAMRMEPVTSDGYDNNPNDGVVPEYDRRHLVTTVSHDDLLTRGGRVPSIVTATTPPITLTDDVLVKMTEANQSAHDPTTFPPRLRPGGVDALPFEYADYPQDLADGCWPTQPGCKLNPRKGRLQLSLAWIDRWFWDDGIAGNFQLNQVTRDRLIYDAFMMLVSNVVGKPWETRKDCEIDEPDTTGRAHCEIGGRCTKVAGSLVGKCADAPRYWEDIACVNPTDDCGPGPFRCDPVIGRCVDPVTGLRRPQALLTRTAAALTANLIDSADMECLAPGRPEDGQGCRSDLDCAGGTCSDRALPTRIALRTFDFAQPVCITQRGQELIAPVRECVVGSTIPTNCPAIASQPFDCVAPGKVAGRELDTNPLQDRYIRPPPTDDYDPIYIYGIEKQPFITEVASHADPAPGLHTIDARAIELLNPYDRDFVPGDQFWIVEYEGTAERNRFAIPQPIVSGVNPMTVLVWSRDMPARTALLTPPPANTIDVPMLLFQPGWTVYLVKQVLYPGDATPTDIVVDQFAIPGGLTDYVGMDSPPVTTPSCDDPANPCRFSHERVASDTPTGRWSGLVPVTQQLGRPATTLGTWNLAADPNLHPVEIRLANLGTFTKPFSNPFSASELAVAYPTTGSLLMLPRHANRSLADIRPPFLVTDLAFTTRLNDTTNVTTAAGIVALNEREQIDNGRMPVFDIPKADATPGANLHAGHHVMPPRLPIPPPPAPRPVGNSGDLDQLPWGQLVFDYFTVLPLANAGPYLDPARGIPPDLLSVDPGSQPRVDLEGLRVHGRININAAPATVLNGLPYVPMGKVPYYLRDRVRTEIGATVADTDAATLGFDLADAIVAYRELRGVGLSGNYDTGAWPPAPPPPPGAILFGHGYNAPTPMARRGGGYMSVGELANIRHFGATGPFRIDAGVVDDYDAATNADNNAENFVDAIAKLYALGDWVTVRSQVFTVYGVLRGENDPSILDSDPAIQAQMQAQDVDSRAVRFQETIDRLPTVLGEPIPTRIGTRSVGRYTDVRND